MTIDTSAESKVCLGWHSGQVVAVSASSDLLASTTSPSYRTPRKDAQIDPAMDSCPYAVNTRYVHTESGLPLTVRYVGPLPPTSTQNAQGSPNGPTWIGVEWDDPTRGKHSGTYQEEQVFETRIPGAASFLKYKPAKQRRPTDGAAGSQTGMLDAGKGFFQAVYERYIDSQLESDTGTPISRNPSSRAVEKIVLGSSNGQIVVEMPNLDKVVRKLRKGVDGALADDGESSLNVKEIGLEGQWVNGVEREGADAAVPGDAIDPRWRTLRGKLNNVHTLNLSHNLIPNWIALARICAELPNLRVLVVNFSRMEPLHKPLAESLPESLKAAFTNIEQLHICHSLVSWEEVRYFSSAFSALRVLDLAGNPLLGDRTTRKDATAEKDLRNLENLDLTDCGLDQWEDVVAILAQTPDSRALNISSNPLSKINLTAPLSKLPALDTIILNDTRVQEWQDIDNLQILFGSSLRTFKYSLAAELLTSNAEKNPTPGASKFKGTLEDRVYLISKLPALETLNGTKITRHERMDAERFYLAQAAKLGIVGADTPGWGRIRELKEVHGESQNAPSKSLVSTTLKSKMLDVVVECPEFGVEPFTLSLLPTAPIKLLKTKIARQLGVPVNSRFGLSMREAGSTETREIPDEDRTSVSSLDLKEGDAVIVEVL